MLSRSSIYTLISIVIVVLMAGVVLQGNRQRNKTGALTEDHILGLTTDSQKTESSGSMVEQLIQGGSDQTKKYAVDTMMSVKDTLVNYLKAEATRLTSAQMKQLTTQLCTDWGVIPSPTQTP